MGVAIPSNSCGKPGMELSFNLQQFELHLMKAPAQQSHGNYRHCEACHRLSSRGGRQAV